MPQQSRADYLAGAQTHDVFNVAEPFENYNSYREDLHLQHLVRSFGAGWADSDLSAWGEKTGSARWLKWGDRKSTRLNSSHVAISYAVFCLKKKTRRKDTDQHI